MKKGAIAAFSLFETLRFPVAGLALIFFLDGPPQPASAQTAKSDDPAQSRAWAPAAIEQAQKMRKFKDADRGSQLTPGIIPRFEADDDPSGRMATFQPGGPTFTPLNAFFQNLGTNGRTCFSCHQPQEGWTVSSAGVSARFEASGGTDPIFRLIDGATCPSDNVKTLADKREAYKLLIAKGLIRIGLPIPMPMPPAPPLQFEVTKVDDPYHCTTLTSPTAGMLSMYRRPLPSTNLGFLSTIMFDGREPSLQSQAIDATLTHAQGDPNHPLTAEQQDQIVAFEKGIFTTQDFDNAAHNLHARNAMGGPVALAAELSKFFIGINDPIDPKFRKGEPFDPNIFDLYKPWQNLRGEDGKTQYRLSVARGEEVFNTTNINITGVAGLNDDLNMPSIAGFCGTCHDTPNVGNHSVKAPLNIGIADAGAKSPPALDISGLPVFTLKCTQGPLAGQIFVVTDPGRALISGQCKDIGRVKGPILRGLAARAPYFHNGSAATLFDAVNFYDQRFSIGFTDQQKEDLVNFLKTL